MIGGLGSYVVCLRALVVYLYGLRFLVKYSALEYLLVIENLRLATFSSEAVGDWAKSGLSEILILIDSLVYGFLRETVDCFSELSLSDMP
jgi:hypothetical protein